MSDISFRHGPEFQRTVLKTMMANQQFCAKAIQYLQPDYFSGELSWFYKTIKEHFLTYKKPPSDKEVKEQIGRHEKDAPKYDKELDEILKVTGVGPEYLRKELTGFIRANIFVNAVRQGADYYNAGDRQASYDLIKKKMDELYAADFEKDRVVRFGDADAMLEIARNQSRDCIPTGIHAIDQAMHGGMMPQTWTLFLGGTNVGKSMINPSLAKYAARYKKKKTFITVHEDEMVQTKLRYLACWSMIPYNKLLQPKESWTEQERKLVADADAELKEFVVMRFMYGRERFIENVCDEVRMMKDQWDFDLFLCDYGQCLKTKANFDKKHDTQEYIYEELGQVCMELNIVGAGGAQVNRLGHQVSKKGSDFLRVTDVGDSFGICRKANNVITMNRSESDMELNRLVFLLDKVRNGKCPVAVQCSTDYSMCVTHFPYMENSTTNLQTEIQVSLGKPKPEND